MSHPTTREAMYILLGLALFSLVIGLWIFQVAHTTQPQYSDPNYGIEAPR